MTTTPTTSPRADPAWEQLEPFLRENAQAVTTTEAYRLGLTANDLGGLVRRRRLERVAQGAYIAVALDELTAASRHRAVVSALLRARQDRVAASHTSGALLHGLPLVDRDLAHVHLARLRGDGETRRHGAFTVHRCPGREAFTRAGGHAVVVPALAVIQTALAVGVRSGITAADGALRQGLTTTDELETWLERLRRTPRLGLARHVVALASPTAESPGESLARLVLHELGHAPVPQHHVVEPDGRVVARVDFYLPALGVVVEFDGRVKYEGHDGAQALAAEKRREDRIRALGYGVVRLVWGDLFHPSRVREAIERAARTAAPHRRSGGGHSPAAMLPTP